MFVLCGQDWDTFVIDSSDPELTRTIVRKRGEQVPSPRAARQYRNLLLDAGFREVTVEVHTGVFTDGSFLPVLTRLAEVCCEHGAIARAQADAWIAEQRERAQADRLFAAVPVLHDGGDQSLRGLPGPAHGSLGIAGWRDGIARPRVAPGSNGTTIIARPTAPALSVDMAARQAGHRLRSGTSSSEVTLWRSSRLLGTCRTMSRSGCSTGRSWNISRSSCPISG